MTDEARRLWALAGERAKEGRYLIERSIELRGEAFRALPVGVTLEFAFGPGREDFDFALIKGEDGAWTSGEGRLMEADIVEEWWQAGNLRIREAAQ
jgi:hypothetical protein